jgi:hypothetical protein
MSVERIRGSVPSIGGRWVVEPVAEVYFDGEDKVVVRATILLPEDVMDGYWGYWHSGYPGWRAVSRQFLSGDWDDGFDQAREWVEEELGKVERTVNDNGGER